MSQRTLGIDFGSKRIGIALTNEAGDFALPHSVVTTSRSRMTEAVEDIARICAENNVGTVVIGDSKDFAGADNVIMKDVEVFIKEFTKKTGLLVMLHPEFMTSIQAERLQGKNDMLDASAAAIMLQSYIDTYDHNR